MQTYTTQMDAARKGIITPQMEIVAKKEYRTPEEIRQLASLLTRVAKNLSEEDEVC